MNTRKYIAVISAVLLLISGGCKKEEDVVEPVELKIIYTFFDDNTVIFGHNNVVTGAPSWDFGNGETSDQNSATIVYPLAGTYTVTLTIATSTGQYFASVEVTIGESEPSIIELTEDEILLCGGTGALNGKTWVWAQYVPQHMLLGQADPWQYWWGAGSNEKEAFNMYDDKMIFSAINHAFSLENNDCVLYHSITN